MPMHDINVKEYECGHCGYKWINRVNGKNGPIPIKCAKCKRSNWNDPRQRIRPREAGLRRKIKGFFELYEYEFPYFRRERGYLVTWPIDLSKKFLEIKPRPTLEELEKVLYPFDYDLRKRRYRYMIPDPNTPGRLIYSSPYKQDPKRPDQRIWNDDNEYDKLKLKEMELRQQYMIEIMKSRGVDYDPELRLTIQREKRSAKFNEFRKESIKKVENICLSDDWILKGVIGDGICHKCKKRRMIITNNDNVRVCKKCGTEVSDKWTGIVMIEKKEGLV